jgi:two-component system phosphate regulon sensor histidine kinase PhoR
MGIAAEHLPRLTERFYRVDRGRSRDTGGTGLGLAIVRDLTQLYGGELQLSDSDLGGLCALLILPAAVMRAK